MAKDNEISNYIVIDCRLSDLEFIKDSIFNSELLNMFDLSKIDWSECDNFATANLVKMACDYKKKNPNMSTMEIGAIMNMFYTTIISYLKKGTNLGWCHYDPREELKKSGAKKGKKNGKQVEIFKDGKSFGIFENCKDLERQSNRLFGIMLRSRNISAVCTNRRSHHKGYTFKYV